MPEAADHVYVERHLGEKVRPLVERWKAHRDLLDLNGRTEKENTEAVEMDPDRHLPTIAEALERFEHDHPGVGTAEIQAFRRDVGLAFG